MESLATLSDGWDAVATDLVTYLPRIGAALLLLLVGWLVARLVRALLQRLASGLEKALRQSSSAEPLEEDTTADLRRRILGTITFWGVFLIFIVGALQILTIDALSGWLGPVAAHLPSIIVGGLIVLAGVALAGLARDLTVMGLRSAAGESQRRLAGKLVQILVVFSATVIGAGQMGLEVTFLVVLAAIVLGAVLGGVALGLGLASRDLFGNLLGSHTLRRHYRVGQSVEIAQLQGRILEINGFGVLLDTPRGRVLVPGKTFNGEPSILTTGSEEAPDEPR